MAAGDVLLNADGTVALDTTGKVRLLDAGGDCADCCAFSCPSGDPHLEVTISWSSAPTGNSGWEATTVGKLDMFGETWASGETKNICPTTYQNNTTTAPGVAWQYLNTGNSGILFQHNSTGIGNPLRMNEDIETKDGARFNWYGETYGATGTFFPTDINNKSITTGFTGGKTGVTYNDAVKPFRFDEFGGQFTTTSDGITIQWQKSAAFP